MVFWRDLRLVMSKLPFFHYENAEGTGSLAVSAFLAVFYVALFDDVYGPVLGFHINVGDIFAQNADRQLDDAA